MSVWTEKLIPRNKYSRPGTKLLSVKKIVKHFTANPGSGVLNHFNYFGKTLLELNAKLPANKQRYASAHIFVDKNDAYLIIPLDEVAYHANDIQKRNTDGSPWRGVKELLPNANLLSIGVELCQEPDGTFHPDTLKRAAEVDAQLCKMFGLDPVNDIIRHYDVTKKNCPAPWVKDPGAFNQFKNDVKVLLNPIAEKGVGELPLKVGDKGEGVRIVHQQLAALGYIMQSDKDRDIYDDWTAGKVKQFQQDQMIRTQNGVYDYYTAKAFAQVLDVYRKHWLKTNK